MIFQTRTPRIFSKLTFILCLTAVRISSAQAQTTEATAPKPKGFNPDIGVNFLGLFQGGTATSNDRTDGNHDGFSLQEAELQFSADVDPYLRGVALMSVSQEAGTTEFGFEPEEVYAESISIPVVTIRGGKFKLALGKHNQLHTHAFPFVDAPLIHQQLLGDEGLNEVGLSTAVLIPVSWYSEIILQVFSPSNEDLFNSPSSRDVGGLARLKNLWDLTDDLTLELGLSGTMGKNQFDEFSSVIASDLTMKWRPAEGGKYHALIWSTEYLDGLRHGLTDATTSASAEKLGGLVTWLQYQMAERWWVQGRYEYVGIPHSNSISTETKQSALIGFFPSEFSGFRVQYDHNRSLGKSDHTVALQMNVSIGAHPAHAY